MNWILLQPLYAWSLLSGFMDWLMGSSQLDSVISCDIYATHILIFSCRVIGYGLRAASTTPRSSYRTILSSHVIRPLFCAGKFTITFPDWQTTVFPFLYCSGLGARVKLLSYQVFIVLLPCVAFLSCSRPAERK